MKPEILTVEWISFGAYIAAEAEKGIIYPDLSPSNVGILDESPAICIIDKDCFEEYPFPGDLHVYATALFSLLGYIQIDQVAAFRFGYVHHGGKFGRLVFDHLRHDFAVTPWADPAQVPTIEHLNDSDWAVNHREWMLRRDSLTLPKLEDAAWKFPNLLFPEESTEVGMHLRHRDSELAFHAFERRLIVELARNNPKAFLLAITDIGQLAAESGETLRSQVWGMTITLLSNDLNKRGLLWPRFVFWPPWTAEDQIRASQMSG